MINWHHINTVFLDMDGTLLDLHFDNYFWRELVPNTYAETHQISPEAAYELLTGKFAEHEGSLNWYCVDFWSDTLQLDIEQMKHDIQHKIAYRPQVNEFLAALQDAGKRTAIITNAHPKSVALKMLRTDLEQQVDRVISSHDFNMPKEYPEFWNALQLEEPFDPDSTLLIDDSLAVLNSARQYGIQHLLSIAQPDSQNPSRTLEDFHALEQFDDINPALTDQQNGNDPHE